MRLAGVLIGLVVAIGGYVLAGVQIQGGNRLRAENEELTQKLEVVEAQMQRIRADGGASGDPITNEEFQEAKRAEELVTELAEAKAQIAMLEATAEATQGSITEVGDAESAAEERDDDSPTLDEIRERVRNNAGVGAQMQAITEMMYKDLFASMELDADTKAAMRELLIDSQKEQAALAGYAMELGDVTFAEQTAWVDAERERLAAQMQNVLSGDEYDAWREYETTIETRMLEATFDNQLNAFSGGLTPENHAMVLDVALEEFVAEQNALRSSDTLFTQSENVLYQIRSMDRMRERLEPVMEPGQYTELANWLDMGERVLRQQLPDDEAAVTP